MAKQAELTGKFGELTDPSMIGPPVSLCMSFPVVPMNVQGLRNTRTGPPAPSFYLCLRDQFSKIEIITIGGGSAARNEPSCLSRYLPRSRRRERRRAKVQ